MPDLTAVQAEMQAEMDRFTKQLRDIRDRHAKLHPPGQPQRSNPASLLMAKMEKAGREHDKRKAEIAAKYGFKRT